jgi:hypothetical protein
MRISLLHKCNELAPLIPKMQTYGARYPAQMPRWIGLQGRRALVPRTRSSQRVVLQKRLELLRRVLVNA